MRYQFKIDAAPASRPRVTKYATFYGKTYTKFRESMAIICDHTEFEPVNEGPIKVTTLIYLAMPKSWSKKKKELFEGQWKMNNSDNDNYEKAVWDGLNGKAWGDDCQIAWNETKVKYAYEGEIIVAVEKLT